MGGDNVAEAQKDGDVRVGIKKQSVPQKKNEDSWGSNLQLRQDDIIERRLAQTEANRDAEHKRE